MRLERGKIVDVALTLLNEGGIDQLTTRRLAERLGVQQPALYWHFKNKNALLDAVNEEILRRGHNRRVPLPGEPWDVFLRENARSFRRALLAYRDGARVHAGNEPAEAELPGSEAQFSCMIEAGFDEATSLHCLIAIGNFVVGCVLEEQATQDRPVAESAILDKLGDFPQLAGAIERQLLVGQDAAFEAAFETGISLIIEGLSHRLAGKEAAAAAVAR